MDKKVAYNDILNYLEEEMSDPSEKYWKFMRISAHEGPLDEWISHSEYAMMVE